MQTDSFFDIPTLFAEFDLASFDVSALEVTPTTVTPSSLGEGYDFVSEAEKGTMTTDNSNVYSSYGFSYFLKAARAREDQYQGGDFPTELLSSPYKYDLKVMGDDLKGVLYGRKIGLGLVYNETLCPVSSGSNKVGGQVPAVTEADSSGTVTVETVDYYGKNEMVIRFAINHCSYHFKRALFRLVVFLEGQGKLQQYIFFSSPFMTFARTPRRVPNNNNSHKNSTNVFMNNLPYFPGKAVSAADIISNTCGQDNYRNPLLFPKECQKLLHDQKTKNVRQWKRKQLLLNDGVEVESLGSMDDANSSNSGSSTFSSSSNEDPLQFDQDICSSSTDCCCFYCNRRHQEELEEQQEAQNRRHHLPIVPAAVADEGFHHRFSPYNPRKLDSSL
jgi:hypothetical protein